MLNLNYIKTTFEEIKSLSDEDLRTFISEAEETLGKLQGLVEVIQDEIIDAETEAASRFDEPYEMTDVEADADTLASAGWGVNEDYGYYGDDGW
jgi:hypothetical protein